MMTTEHRKELWRALTTGVMAAQVYAQEKRYSAADTMPEILVGMISLAAFAAKGNMDFSAKEFLKVAQSAAEEHWREKFTIVERND